MSQPPQTTLPNFEDPEWARKHEELGKAVADATEALISHMRGPGALHLTMVFHTENGRHIQLDVNASPPVTAH